MKCWYHKDEVAYIYLDSVIKITRTIDGEERDSLICIGKVGHAKFNFKVIDIISCGCFPVPGSDMRTVDYYKLL